jgi:uncharacterized protein (DUF1015 family)
MQISSFSAIFPPEQFGSAIDSFCDAARNQLSKAFLPYNKPAPQQEGLLILEIISEQWKSTGIICLTNIIDYKDNKLQLHEDTIYSKLKKQKEYLAKQGTFIKPILAALEEYPTLSLWLTKEMQKPVFKSYTSLKKNQIFNFWLVDDTNAVEEMKYFFSSEVKYALIADGHHRSAACLSLFEEGNRHFEYLLTAYFPIDQLMIKSFHRIYSLHKETDLYRVFHQMAYHFELTLLSTPFLPETNHKVLIGIKDKWYMGTFKNVDPEIPDVIYFEKILPDIIDMNRIYSIQYPEDNIDIRQFVEERKGIYPVLALSFFPIPKNDWVSAIKKKLFFPPKSTRFMPTLRSGLTMYDFKKDFPKKKV